MLDSITFVPFWQVELAIVGAAVCGVVLGYLWARHQ